jgi:hypothetical protein
MDFEIMNSGKLTLLFGFVLACLISPISGIAAEKGKFAGNAEQVSAQAVDAYQAGNFSLAATYFKRVVQLAPANVKDWLLWRIAGQKRRQHGRPPCLCQGDGVAIFRPGGGTRG